MKIIIDAERETELNLSDLIGEWDGEFEIINSKDLKEIDFSYTKITDISTLTSCKNLRKADFSFTYITDISTLTSCENLEWIDLSLNYVTDISPLIGCKKLKSIHLDAFKVKDMSFIEELKNRGVQISVV